MDVIVNDLVHAIVGTLGVVAGVIILIVIIFMLLPKPSKPTK